MNALRWAGLTGAIWFSVSILIAVAWGLARRGGWRGATADPPVLRLVHRDGSPVSDREASAVRSIMEIDAEMRGR